MTPCNTGIAALSELVHADYAFATAAQQSVRTAFLTYLAAESLVLQPEVRAGRATYEAASEGHSHLQWYPSEADAAPSGDLGFSVGPWAAADARPAPPPGAAAKDRGERHGHYVTVWTRDARCRWQVQVDGGVSHAAQAHDDTRLTVESLRPAPSAEPASRLIDGDSVGHAIRDFAQVFAQEGLAAALRTYGRNNDFMLLLDEHAPFQGVDPANAHLVAHAVLSSSRERVQGRSRDSTMAYSVGELIDSKRRATHSYVEIWQYDPKVANWGVRVLLLNALTQFG